jgi:hypothetical protein
MRDSLKFQTSLTPVQPGQEGDRFGQPSSKMGKSHTKEKRKREKEGENGWNIWDRISGLSRGFKHQIRAQMTSTVSK